MKSSSISALLIASLVVAAFVKSASAVVCYHCQSNQASDPNEDSCGHIFNAIVVKRMTLNYNATCDGVCLTQVTFSSYDSAGQDTYYRTCSTAHPTDGCTEADPKYNGGIRAWSCIKTCTENWCNNNSHAFAVLPSIAVLVTSALVAVYSLLLV